MKRNLKMKIFLIDDDPLSIFLTQHLLNLEELENIQTFLWAKDALAFLKNCTNEEIPAIIFLDLNMPDMSGWEFLDELVPLEPKLRGKCRIYILTSSLETSDNIRSQEYSLVYGLIHKPLSPEDIKLITQKEFEDLQQQIFKYIANPL